jgi:hypothetical protein
MSNPISHWEVSFLAPYPKVKGERRVQAFYSKEEAEHMRDYYNSLGSYDAKTYLSGENISIPDDTTGGISLPYHPGPT